MKNKKTALVTGAGSGVGRAIAKTLAQEGFTAILTGRRENKLKETAQEINGDTLIFAADVTDPAEVKDLKKKIEERTDGRLDILVNNVGGVPVMGSIDQLTQDQWNLVMDTNLTSQFLVTQAFIPLLRKTEKAKIISVTSGMANFFMNGFGAYSASKAAVEAFMKTVAEEEKENDISVHLFDPENVISEGNPQGEKDPMEVMGKIKDLL